MKSNITKKHEGITLIALVVTIVVLLILAGVSINAILGDSGIISQAKKAAQAAKDAATNDEENLKDLADTINSMIGSSGAGGQTDSDKNAIAKEYGKKQEIENKKITDESGKLLITIPKGFTLVDPNTDSTIEYADKNNPTVDDGLVIKDDAGNEFVWIPCKEEEYVKHTYNSSNTNDAGTNIPDTAGGWNTWYYRNYKDWKDDEINETDNVTSVKNNGGFYIARYEAGVPSGASFYVEASAEGAKTYQTSKNNINGDLKPVSKKGMQAWNLISQINAKEVSGRMYSGESYGVRSQLVDGTAWDTAVTWMSKAYTGIEKDSTTHGNYANNTADATKIKEDNCLFAEHLYKYESGTGRGWCTGTNYKYGTFTSGYTANWKPTDTDKGENYNNYSADSKYTYNHYVEMATGASDNTKLKNIYDMAGNMYEWTTEYGYHDVEKPSGTDSRTKYAVLRGGGFINHGTSGPVALRSGDGAATYAGDPSIGFRVVLYVK